MTRYKHTSELQTYAYEYVFQFFWYLVRTDPQMFLTLEIRTLCRFRIFWHKKKVQVSSFQKPTQGPNLATVATRNLLQLKKKSRLAS